MSPNDIIEGRKNVLAKLKTSEELLKEDVKNLQLWLSRQPHLRCLQHLSEERRLENLLILAKNSLEKAKSTMDRYGIIRDALPHLYFHKDILNDKELHLSFEHVTAAYLPGLTPRLHKVVFLRTEKSLPDIFDIDSLLKRAVLGMEYILRAGVDFTGIHAVLDLKNARFNQISAFNITSMKNMQAVMKTYPTSLVTFNVINYPAFIEKGVKVIKPFLSEKLMSRVVLMEDLDSLKEAIGDVELPADYGGNCKLTLKDLSEILKNNFTNMRDYFAKCSLENIPQKAKVLPKQCNSKQEIGSIDGSFRMLSID